MRTSTPVRMRDCTVAHAGHSARSTHVAEPRVWMPGAWNGTLKASGSAQAHASTAWSAGTQEGATTARSISGRASGWLTVYGWGYRKFKRHFHPAAVTARLWPACAGGRCSRAALAAPPARSRDLPLRRIARRGAAERGLDIPLRMGSVSASGVLRGRGPWDGPSWESWGGVNQLSDDQHQGGQRGSRAQHYVRSRGTILTVKGDSENARAQ